MPIFLAFIALLVAAAALALVLVLFFRLRSLAERQEGVISELEQIGAAQRRVLEQFHSLAHHQRMLVEKLGNSDAEASHRQQEESARLDPQKVKEDILFLARQGLSAETIARDLNIPRGEVELILDLERFSAKS
jgi:uncharacterized coiled-coil protein SlyX